MKPIVKILFAALIICVSLVLPKRAHASQMYCQSPGINQCQGAGEQALYQCMSNCVHTGGYTQLVIDYAVVSCPPGEPCTRNSVNHSLVVQNAFCMQDCVNTFTPGITACVAQYCSYQ